MPGPADTYIGYGRNWANVSNTPFREYKHFVHEGGISTPLVVHRPNGIKAQNELRSEPSHLIDMMATCLDAAGAEYPLQYKSNAITPREGKSLLPVFAGQSLDREIIFFEHEGNRAVRLGKWKLVSRYPGKWELYDLQADRTERNDLAAKHPQRVKKMVVLYSTWAARSEVLPWRSWVKKKPKK